MLQRNDQITLLFLLQNGLVLGESLPRIGNGRSSKGTRWFEAGIQVGVIREDGT